LAGRVTEELDGMKVSGGAEDETSEDETGGASGVLSGAGGTTKDSDRPT
jgi:hypothetical protein